MAANGTAKSRLGYIGIGLMGLPMVRHLLPKGYAITVFDIDAARCRTAGELGAKVAANPADVVAGADIVILNLPTLDALEGVMFGAGGVAMAMKPPQVLLDFSTIPVEACRRLGARLLAERGCGWVDAPVSGGPPASGTGTLTVMAGGREADLAQVAGLIADVSARYTIMGGPGGGMVAKMINQMIVGCTHAVLAEALMVAEAAGIDAKRIPECLAGGHADSNLLQRNYPRMAAREFAPQGYARQMLKDLEMVNVFTGALKTATPMTADALNLYRMAVHMGHAELDTTALVKVYDREG